MDASRKRLISRLGIVVIAAVMVEIISLVQYERYRNMMLGEMEVRDRIILSAMADDIGHVLELSETTMKENVWVLEHQLSHPDSLYQALKYLIDDDPHVLGGCLAFAPDYYPSEGRLFEPYVSKEGGTITMSQIAGPDHDYTENESFKKVMDTHRPVWSEPYRYGPDSLSMTTYSYPVRDGEDRIAAVCGLDLDLTWLGDTLNTIQPYPSSFGMLLNEDGRLVAGPSEERIPTSEVSRVLGILDGSVPESANPDIVIKKANMNRSPYWQVVEVYRTDEVFAPLRRMRLQHLLFALLGLAILAFMIDRYARNEKKLSEASEEHARIEGELAAAKQIQQEMIPHSFPPFAYGTLEPARDVGGDVFDFYIRDGKVFFCIGDVTGKGVGSAMLMSGAHSLFRMVSEKEESPSRILYALNQQLCRGNDSCMFVTFFVGCLDLYSGELRFGNAGHDKPFLISDSIELMPVKSNFPLGVFPDTHFEEQECMLAPGTILFMYTDGLTEAKNVERKAFGKERLMAVLSDFLAAGKDAPLENLISSMSEAAHRFAGEEPQSDDLTMLVLRFDPEDALQEQITLRNDTSEVTRLGDFSKEFLDRLELDRKTSSGLRLALEEAVVNVIFYAYPPGVEGSILVKADSNRKEVRFTIIDSGIPFDPTSVMEADVTLSVHNRPIGGLGVLLSRRLTDSVAYTRRNGQNVLTLTKSIL